MKNVDTVILSLERVSETLSAIESALQQAEVDGLVIVVDQGSSPATVAALQRLADESDRVVLDLQAENLGVPGGRRRGLELSSAQFVAFLDNDAVFEGAGMLRRAVDFFAEPDVAALSFRVVLASSGELDQLSWVHRLDWQSRAAETFHASQFIGAGFMLRRSAYDVTPGLHSPLFFYWEELDLAYALRSAGYEVLHVGELIVRHNVSPERRVTWSGGRFYYYVRNRVAIEWKYFGLRRAFTFGFWYLLLALRRGHTRDAVRALRDCRGLYERPFGVMSRRGRARQKELSPGPGDRAALALRKLRASS
jgi:GT2 family glycosyltransferase